MNNFDWKSKAEGIVSEFFKSKKNWNSLLELEELLLSSDENCVLSICEIISSFFSKVFSVGLLSSASNSDKNAEYKLWLLNRYEDILSHLLSFLMHNNAEIQVSALRTLMSFLQLESNYLPDCTETGMRHFPYKLFMRIISNLVSSILNQHHLINVFQEYTQYADIKLYLLKSLQELLSNFNDQVSDIFLQNCLLLLCCLKFPSKFDDAESANTFAYHTGEHQFQLKEKPFRKLFSSVWNCFLNYELSPAILKKVLLLLNENLLLHFQNPCLMTDFLTNSYNKGGVFSLLALKGLYLLMDRYNLEYPDFFRKLYTLLDKNIINGKFSSRFFILIDLFLSSTHLSAHIAAAFAKKFCRLSLISSTNNILKILCLVSNLLVNHPSLSVLVHQTDVQDFSEDPFNADVVDPSESNAIKSS